VKPAEQTPLTALKLAEKAGIPKGVLNVITGDPKEIGAVLLEDDRVRKLTFTGSTEVGKYLMRGAVETVKKSFPGAKFRTFLLIGVEIAPNF
jgi:succinate-semialdehyde dehydrogenase/glutarate-semialdehyde dehydrogenase